MTQASRIKAATCLQDLTVWNRRLNLERPDNRKRYVAENQAKINPLVKQLIKEDLASGNYKTYDSIAKVYGVTGSTVKGISIREGVELIK